MTGSSNIKGHAFGGAGEIETVAYRINYYRRRITATTICIIKIYWAVTIVILAVIASCAVDVTTAIV